MRFQPYLHRSLPFSFLFLNSLQGSTVSAELAVRGDDDGNCAPDPSDVSQKVAGDGKPGIGFEFECGQILLRPEKDGCTYAQLQKAKGHGLGARKGTNWELTADTTLIDDGFVDAEYILNGETIGLGSGALQTAAEDAARDIKDWNPWTQMNPNSWEIDQNECNNWKVVAPETSGETSGLSFQPQATAPMPLEAVYDLFVKALRKEPFVLIPRFTLRTQVCVTKDFFKASPGGLAASSLKPDVLGFFSIVVSYLKAKKTEQDLLSDSIKDVTSIMPRNYFSSIYKLLKDTERMPAIEGKLWDFFTKLACYKNDPPSDKAIFDDEFCDNEANPTPKQGKLENAPYTYARGTEQCTMKEWIESIEAGTTPDSISRVDKEVDGSVGGFEDKFESVLGNKDRQVPIFEFRRLQGTAPDDFGSKVKAVEDAIIAYHGQFKTPTRLLRKKRNRKYSHIKRNATDACVAPTLAPASSTNTLPPTSSTANSTTTPPPTTPTPSMPSCSKLDADPGDGRDKGACVCGSMTLPLLNITATMDDSESCAYTAMPSSSVAIPITTDVQTFTSNCHMCTLVGGYADTPTCATTLIDGCSPTTPAAPTATVWLSNNSVAIGDVNNKNNGSDLRTELFQGLQKLCPDDKYSCDTTTPVEINGVETVVDDGPAEGKLTFTIETSNYTSSQERDQMIAAAVASWQQALQCGNVEYKDEMDETQSGCPSGPVKRALMTPEERKNMPRAPAPICDGCDPPKSMCTYTGTICAGPNLITSILGNGRSPYANHMDVEVAFKLDQAGNSAFDEFLCEEIIGALSALAMAVAPELAGAEIWEDVELEAMCGELGEQFGGSRR